MLLLPAQEQQKPQVRTVKDIETLAGTYTLADILGRVEPSGITQAGGTRSSSEMQTIPTRITVK